MLVSSSAIVLSKVRYQDNDLIIKCLTRDLGVVTYMVKNISVSKKSKNKFAFFQLLNILGQLSSKCLKAYLCFFLVTSFQPPLKI